MAVPLHVMPVGPTFFGLIPGCVRKKLLALTTSATTWRTVLAVLYIKNPKHDLARNGFILREAVFLVVR